MFALYHGHHPERCYRQSASECHNGRPTDSANTVILVGSWQCGTGAGGGGCTRGHERISAEYIESSAEKTAQAKREDAENRAAVIGCENNPGDALIQEGSAPRYLYECLTWGKLGEECSEYPAICREAMYSESQATTKWEERVAQACHAVGDIVSQHTRKQNGVLEYECTAEEGSANVAWVSFAVYAARRIRRMDRPGAGIPSCITLSIGCQERACGDVTRLVNAAMLALILLGLVAPALAQAESLEISQGPEPTPGRAREHQGLGRGGWASQALRVREYLWRVFVLRLSTTEARPLANGTTLSGGSFENSYSYTPTEVQTYTLCAYLDENEFATPDVSATSSFTAMMPSASAAIEIAGKLTQEIPMKIKVSGTTEVARKLYVFVNTFGGCSSSPQYDGGSPLANGTSIQCRRLQRRILLHPDRDSDLHRLRLC